MRSYCPMFVAPYTCTNPTGRQCVVMRWWALSSPNNEPHSYPLVPKPKENLTFWYPWTNKAHKQQNTARDYLSLLNQLLLP